MSGIDILFTIAIPFLIITVANLLIIYKLMKSTKPMVDDLKRIRTKFKMSPYESSNSFSSSHHRFASRHTSKEASSGKQKRIRFQHCENDRTNSIKFLDDVDHSEFSVRYKNQSQTKGLRNFRSFNSLHNQEDRVSRKVSINSMNETMSEFQFNVFNGVKSNQILRKSVRTKRYKSYSETTKTLLVISIMFLILHLPIGLNKLWYLVRENFQTNYENVEKVDVFKMNNKEFANLNSNFTYEFLNSTMMKSYLNKINSNEFEEIFERLSCYVYYFNFSLNFFLYTYNKAKFRQTFLDSLKKIFRVKKRRRNDKYH